MPSMLVAHLTVMLAADRPLLPLGETTPCMQRYIVQAKLTQGPECTLARLFVRGCMELNHASSTLSVLLMPSPHCPLPCHGCCCFL